MSEVGTDENKAVSESLIEWIDAIVDRFESALQGGKEPGIRDYVEGVAEGRKMALLQELVMVDLEHRWKAGEERRLEDYVQEFPELLQGSVSSLEPLVDHARELRSRFHPGTASPETEQTGAGPGSQGIHLQFSPFPSRVKVTGDDRYTVKGEIARGGLGRVLRVLDHEMNRDVALKELLPDRPAMKGRGPRRAISRVARFLAEAKITGRLEHPSIVPVYEIGRRADGKVYYTMKIVRGHTLAQAVRGIDLHQAARVHGQEDEEAMAAPPARARPLELRDRLGLLPHFVDVCQAIAYAHSQGVIHRDLKPHNIMIGSYGETVVLDWGLAKVRGEEDLRASEIGDGLRQLREGKGYQTMTGDVIGTPAYMPPEQAQGFIDAVDERSDVYSLGAVLYELLTGQPPHYGETSQLLLDKAVASHHRPVLEVEPMAPPELAAICEKALQKVPQDRYPTAELLARDVQDYLSHQVEDRIRAEAREQAARRYLYVAHINLAQQAWDLGDTARAMELLENHLPETGEEDQRGYEWYCLWHLSQRQQRATFYGHAGAVWSVCVSPDGQLLASAGEDRVIRLWNLSTNKELLSLAGHSNIVTCLAFSPDGGLLASGSVDTEVYLWNVESGEQAARLVGHRRTVSSLAFSPDGRVLATGAFDRTIKLWDVDQGREVTTIVGHEHRIRSLAFSPDGSALATAGGVFDQPGEVRVWETRHPSEQPQLKFLLRGHSGPVNSVAFSHQGKLLATGGWDRAVKLWDPITGLEKSTLRGHTEGVLAVGFSPDGKTLASGSGEKNIPGMIKLWDVLTGSEKATLKGHREGVLSLAFTRDDRFLCSGSFDRTIKLWELGLAELTVPRLRGHTTGATSVAVFPNGSIAVTGSVDKTIKLWDTSNGREIGTLRGHTKTITALACSPDNRTIASGSADNSIKLWDSRSLTEAATISGHSGSVNSLVFSDDGRTLISASHDRSIKTWDTLTQGELASLTGHKGGILAMALAPDGKTLATAGQDHTIRLWALAGASGNSEALAVLQAHTDEVTGIAFSPDGKRLASCSNDHTLRFWDLATHQAEAALEFNDAPLYCLAFTPDGQSVALGALEQMILVDPEAAQVQKTIPMKIGGVVAMSASLEEALMAIGGHRSALLWNLGEESERCQLSGHTLTVLSVAFLPDGHTIASAGRDSLIRVWDINQLKEKAVLKGHRGTIYSIAASPDGQFLASGGFDKTVRLWNAQDLSAGEPLYNLGAHKDRIAFLAFSPDSRSLATASRDRTIKLWDLKSRVVHLTIEDQSEVNCLAFSPDSRLLAAGGGSRVNRPEDIRLWNAHRGQLMAVLKGHRGSVQSLAFSPSGDWLASASSDDTVKLWNARNLSMNMQAEKTLLGHRDRITYLAFSPDGKSIATGSADRSVKLWDPVTGQELMTLGEHSEWVNAVAFSPDGKTLATVSWDGTISLWPAAEDGDVAAWYARQAWLLANGEDPELHDPELAVKHGRMAVRLWPRGGQPELALGAALFRNRRFGEAISFLENSLDPGRGSSVDTSLRAWFFLAMANASLERNEEAMKWYREAANWLESANSDDREVQRLKAETEKTLDLRP